MNRLKHLLEERGRMESEVLAIAELCDKEKRARTTEEKLKYNSLKDQIEDAADEIQMLETLRAEDMKTMKPVKRMTDPHDIGTEQRDSDDSEKRFLDKVHSVSLISSKQQLARKEDRGEVGLGRLILAKLAGPQNEAERRALDTSLDASGGISTKVSRKFWDRARAASTVVAAGGQVLDFENGADAAGVVKIPQIVTDPVPYWKVENAPVTLSDPTFTAKTFNFHTLFAATQVSQELIQDGGPLFADMLETSLSKSFSSEIDRVALIGSGVGEEPLGISGMPINAVPSGGTLDYGDMVAAVGALLGSNIPLSAVGAFIMGPGAWTSLVSQKSAVELQPLLMPQGINDIPWLVSSKVPATDVFIGDWSQLIIGMRLHIKIRFHEQTLAQSFSTLVTCAARCDIQVQNPKAFSKITGITAAAAPEGAGSSALAKEMAVPYATKPSKK